MCLYSMENKSEIKPKTEKPNQYSHDDFVLNLIDVNDSFDLKDSGDKD